MKRFGILVFIVMVSLVALAGCGRDKVDIGIILPTRDEPRWIQDEERFKAALEDSEHTVEILFSQGSTAIELENVETLITKGIQVLIITAQDGDAAGAAVELARAEGIKVIAYDRLITNTDAVDYYVTFDSIAVGEAQGQFLVDAATGKDNPLYLYAGAATDNNAFLFFEGAWNVLQPKIEDGTFEIINSSKAVELQDEATLTRAQRADIIGQISTNWDFNTALTLAESHLTAADATDKGDVFILAPNDGTARAIAGAFETDTDISSFIITGQDAEKASIQFILDGKQSMTVFKDVRTLVTDAMDIAIALLEGNTPATTGTIHNGEIDIPTKQSDVIVVTKDNVRTVLIDSEFYLEEDFNFPS